VPRTQSSSGGRDAHLVRHLLDVEGAGIDWPAGDASLLLVIAFVVGVSLALVAFVDRSMGTARSHRERSRREVARRVRRFWYDFIVGDDWRLAICVVVMVGW
jgi:hypothetical protein